MMRIDQYLAGPHTISSQNLGITFLSTSPLTENIGYWRVKHVSGFSRDKKESIIATRPCSGKIADKIEEFAKSRFAYDVKGEMFSCFDDPNDDLPLESTGGS